MEMENRTIYCFRTDRQDVGRSLADEPQQESIEPNDPLFCKVCGQAITGRDQRIAVNDSHAHTFFNPAGIVFELGCFRNAFGCIVAGDVTAEFTWFAGYLWRFALCSQCRAHLGWFYERGDHSFYGLILTTLTE